MIEYLPITWREAIIGFPIGVALLLWCFGASRRLISIVGFLTLIIFLIGTAAYVVLKMHYVMNTTVALVPVIGVALLAVSPMAVVYCLHWRSSQSRR